VTEGSVVLPPVQWECCMTAPDEYQRYATECIAWAHKAKTDAKPFLDMGPRLGAGSREDERRGGSARISG
jgi:hypothetical protein